MFELSFVSSIMIHVYLATYYGGDGDDTWPSSASFNPSNSFNFQPINSKFGTNSWTPPTAQVWEESDQSNLSSPTMTFFPFFLLIWQNRPFISELIVVCGDTDAIAKILPIPLMQKSPMQKFRQLNPLRTFPLPVLNDSYLGILE